MMKVNADLYVKDIPGQLVSTLDPISLVDGNIVGVVHNREKMMEGRIGVNITFEISPSNLERLKGIWKSRDVIISSIGSVVETYPMVYMLIGGIDARYVEALLEKAGKTIGFDSVDVRITSKTGSPKNTVMISAKLRIESDIRKLDEFIASECSDSVTYIRGMGE